MGYRVVEPARNLFLTHFGKDAYLPAIEEARRLVRARDTKQGLPALEAIIRNYVLSKQLTGTRAEPPGRNDALAAFGW